MSTKENASFNFVNRGGYALSIGNGQIHDALSPSYEVCKTLNCMDDPMKVLIVKGTDDGSMLVGWESDSSDINPK
jgi:hypothetical protein